MERAAFSFKDVCKTLHDLWFKLLKDLALLKYCLSTHLPLAFLPLRDLQSQIWNGSSAFVSACTEVI